MKMVDVISSYLEIGERILFGLVYLMTPTEHFVVQFPTFYILGIQPIVGISNHGTM